MLEKKVIIIILGSILCTALVGCADETAEPHSDAPVHTVSRILELHGLFGTTPGMRSESAKTAPVDSAALNKLFADYSMHDPFLADLYVGFITGVLSRHQDRLRVSVRGKRAEVTAGKLIIQFRHNDNSWQVHLASSIPEAIKIRARAEKARFSKNKLISAR